MREQEDWDGTNEFTLLVSAALGWIVLGSDLHLTLHAAYVSSGLNQI